MSFHFASSEYASSFQDLPEPNVPKIRESAIYYLDNFDEKEWYDNPVSLCTDTQTFSTKKNDIYDTV
jgi:hypothetical protein